MRARLARVLGAGLVALAGSVAVAVAAVQGGSGDVPAAGSATEAWGALSSSPLERTEVAAARIGRHIYVVGGYTTDGVGTGRMVRYDIETDRWTEVSPLPIAVNHPGVASLGGRVYVHGGLETVGRSEIATPSLYRYNPKQDRWTRLSDGGQPRAAHAFEPIGKRLYAAAGNDISAGGSDPSGDLRTAEVYNPHKDRWRPLRRLPSARNHVAGAVLDGRLYVLGGRARGENFDLVERFNPKAGSRGRWRELAPLQTARSGFAAVASRGTIVAFGGEELGLGDATTIDPVEQYRPERDRWSSLPPMITPRHGLGGVVRKGRIYAVEGGPRPALHVSAANEYLDLP